SPRSRSPRGGCRRCSDATDAPTGRRPLRSIPRADPRLVECGVLDALERGLRTRLAVILRGDEGAVNRVDRAVAALDHGRVMISAALVGRQVPGLRPSPALVVRDRDDQRRAAGWGVVVDE